ncbi:MAG: peptidylprolyl isomerase [Candidatus Krumholzibacteria bacterium]|jgi:peptidyl-prolyl cis-trans isomerase B (cyclophilin B)|nr:peptidylprolyl isomerase [Candidatus Krumholzibacteria bacterium]
MRWNSIRCLAPCCLASMVWLAAASAPAVPPDHEVPCVRLHTEAGEILLALFPDLAPHHANNFLHLARTGFYDGTYFHRIVPGFVIQGGDPNTKDRDPRNDGQGGPTLADVLTPAEQARLQEASAVLTAKGYTGLPLDARANLKAEFSPTARHLRGTLSMARARENDSAGSQFFVCVDRTAALDRQYTVFGQVIAGMEAVDKIVTAEIDPARGRESPRDPVKILKIDLVTGIGSLTAAEQTAYREMLQTLAAGGSTW